MKMPLANKPTDAHLYRDLPPNARVGIFGGTFDPIHLGHLILAEEARVQLKLDRVYLMPAGDPPHKQDRHITPVQHRICMAELATAASRHLWVSRLDADRPGPHYSLDTVRLLQVEMGPESAIFFLMGLDSLRNLPTWRNPEQLIREAKLVVLTRPSVDVNWAQLKRSLPEIQKHVILLKMPALEISSSVLRERLRAGVSVQFQIPHAVETYIAKHRLYSL